jgi:hypothetical protein
MMSQSNSWILAKSTFFWIHIFLSSIYGWDLRILEEKIKILTFFLFTLILKSNIAKLSHKQKLGLYYSSQLFHFFIEMNQM